MVKPEYDRSLLDELAKPFVEDNIRKGYPHYNVVDWVCSAYPQYRDEINATLRELTQGANPGPAGRLVFSREHILKFLAAWKKPSRDVRRMNAKKDK